MLCSACVRAARLIFRPRRPQAALEAGRTELAISLPPGMRFGLFGDPGKQVIGTPGAEPYPTPSPYP